MLLLFFVVVYCVSVFFLVFAVVLGVLLMSFVVCLLFDVFATCYCFLLFHCRLRMFMYVCCWCFRAFCNVCQGFLSVCCLHVSMHVYILLALSCFVLIFPLHSRPFSLPLPPLPSCLYYHVCFFIAHMFVCAGSSTICSCS